MNPRTFYRLALIAILIITVAGAVEFGDWGVLLVVAGIGLAVWRSEFPTWDELWDREDSA